MLTNHNAAKRQGTSSSTRTVANAYTQSHTFTHTHTGDSGAVVPTSKYVKQIINVEVTLTFTKKV